MLLLCGQISMWMSAAPAAGLFMCNNQSYNLQPVNLAIFTTSSLFNPLAVPASSVATFSRPPTISSLWTPAQRKLASMLYFANVFFNFIFFMAALFSGPG